MTLWLNLIRSHGAGDTVQFTQYAKSLRYYLTRCSFTLLGCLFESLALSSMQWCWLLVGKRSPRLLMSTVKWIPPSWLLLTSHHESLQQWLSAALSFWSISWKHFPGKLPTVVSTLKILIYASWDNWWILLSNNQQLQYLLHNMHFFPTIAATVLILMVFGQFLKLQQLSGEAAKSIYSSKVAPDNHPPDNIISPSFVQFPSIGWVMILLDDCARLSLYWCNF